jgi:DNA polymerase III alpha subunit
MLKIRTGYSFRSAAGPLEAVAERLKEIGGDVAPITDRASTFGWARWQKIVEKKGMRPVFGVELAVSPDPSAKKPVSDYWTFVSRDTVRPINDLVELATMQFRYQPLLSIAQGLAAAQHVNVIMGHRPVVNWEEIPEGAYLGLGPATTRGLLKQATKYGIRLAATGDNKYVRPEDRGFYEVLLGRNAETQTYAQHILSEEEWRASVDHLGLFPDDLNAALATSREILEQSTAKLLKASLPEIAAPRSLRELCEEGATLLACDLSDPVYEARLGRELALIEEKGYQDYFYIVADLCQWARGKMIVGPARGSSCGSLVCYLLRITTIDPIPFGLIFERFIDVNRNDMPDIDIDFSDQQRHLVFEYLANKYGAERVARIGAVAMMGPKSALSEAGQALRIPKWKCDAVAESIIERSSGDARAMLTLTDTLENTPAGRRLLEEHPEAVIVGRFEGHPHHYTQHAAGVVLARQPIKDYVAIDQRTGATMCDKKDAEDVYNLLKIDALGLTQLSVFEDALELAGLPADTLEKAPLEDDAAFKVLRDGNYAGIFQFTGIALQSVAKQFPVTKFDDIVSITALARPGPLASGGANEWVARRNGEKPVTYPHSSFEPYLNDTLGVVLYQEQVMEIGRNIGDLDWGQVTALRKAMSKSLGKEYFDQFGDPWKRGAIAKGVPPAEADKVWDDLCAYGSWSFNKSHSVAYGLISYWCCWLKAHWPFEYAAAVLTHEKNPDTQISLLREMALEGYDYIPVDAKQSTEKWRPGIRDGRKVLVGPLQNVYGIGPKLVSQILSSRARREPMPDRAQKILAEPTTSLDSLWPIRDAFRKLLPDPLARSIRSTPTPIIKIKPHRNDYEVMVFCTPSKITPRDENEVVLVAKRNGREIKDGRTAFVNLFLKDDTDTIYAKITRFDYEKLGKEMVDRNRPGKALYAIKGLVKGNTNFRMIQVTAIRYIGDLDDLKPKKGKAKETKEAAAAA